MSYAHDMADLTGTLDKVLEVVVLLQADMTRQLGDRQLTQARTHVLWELARKPGAHQRQLADAVGVTPRTMTGLVDGLETTGFVTRTPDPDDRRAVRLELTKKGRATAAWLVSSHEELARTLFGPMSASRHACFDAGLTEVLTRLREAT